MPLRQVAPNQYEIEVSEFDTDDGISIRVVGEDFPRVTLNAAGLAVGDGTEAPADLDLSTLAATLEDFETRISALE